MRRTIGWIVVVLAGGVGLFMVMVTAVLLLGQETPAAIFGAVLAAFSLWIAVKNLRSLWGVSPRKGVSEPDLQSRPSLPDPDAEPPVRVIVQDRTPASGRAPAGRHKRGSRATHSTSGISFGYADHVGAFEHSGPFAIVDVETTGFAADGDDRVIEVAVVRTDGQGRIEDEWTTLINPDRDTGPVFVHHITNEAVANAPRFEQVADELLARLEGSIVVAHNASFDERFLRAELGRAGYQGLQAPALCSLWLSRSTLEAPNYKLGTLGHQYKVASVDAHTALGDVRTIARLLPIMLDKQDRALAYPVRPYQHQRSGVAAPRVVTRAATLRKGEVGWMNTLLDRLPISADDIVDDVADHYLEALSIALSDGKIVGDEAKQLARIAGQGGLGATQVRTLNERFLEGLREASFADDILTPDELISLNRAAAALGSADYFDDLFPTPAKAELSSSTPDSSPATHAAGRTRRCGYCREPGHYRPRCPQLLAGQHS